MNESQIFQEIETLKQLVYTLKAAPTYDAVGESDLRKVRKELETQNSLMATRIHKLETQLAEMAAENRALKSYADSKATTAMKVTCEAVGGLLRDELDGVDGKLKSTLGNVYTDVQAAKNASAINVKMAADFLVGQASHLIAKV